MATIIDCYCIGIAMAYAQKQEDRDIDSTPSYRYATGRLKINYYTPTSTKNLITLRAQIIEHNQRKITMTCSLKAEI